MGKPKTKTQEEQNMSEWKNGKCLVYEDRHGNTRCGVCCAALFCDDNGDMPDTCPCCGAPLDYSIYNPAAEIGKEA